MTALLIVSAVVCLVGEYLDSAVLVYVGKPLATLAVIMLAVRSTTPVSARYRALISAGLMCSLAGDVFLMLPSDQFIAGLVSFLVAHLFYLAAFVGGGGDWRNLKAAAVFLIAGAVLAMLWPTLGALRIQVTVYVTVIATMAWQAIARWQRLGSFGSQLAANGAVIFLLSDASLAWRKFRGDFPGSVLVVLGTYWLAQWCIAQSVTERRRER
jgi:uncharacterized membrane protein YhhN